jgi:hypothetical protein
MLPPAERGLENWRDIARGDGETGATLSTLPALLHFSARQALDGWFIRVAYRRLSAYDFSTLCIYRYTLQAMGMPGNQIAPMCGYLCVDLVDLRASS